LWKDFEQHRRDIRKPLSDRARALNANVLLRLSQEQQRQSVEDTIRNRWTGLFEPKGGPTNGKPTGLDRIAAAERAVDEARARRNGDFSS
jgi:hypothetical protein